MSVKSSHKITHQQADGLVYLPFAKRYQFSFADLDVDLKARIPVEAGTWVLGVAAHIVAAFTDAGTQALIIGDSDTANGWIPTAIIDPSVLNASAHSIGGTGAFAQGKYYAAANLIILDFTDVSTTGTIEVFVLYNGQEN